MGIRVVVETQMVLVEESLASLGEGLPSEEGECELLVPILSSIGG
jgi:hypothetical protein